MHTYKPVEQRTWLLHLFLVVGLVFLAMLEMLSTAKMAHADSIPGGNVSDPVVRAVDIAKPSVVRILTTLNGHLTVHFSTTQLITFPQGGRSGYPLTLSGSGAFISAHGDILTADHVVNPPHDSSLDQFLEQSAAKDVANYYNQNNPSASPVTSDQITTALANGQLPSDTQYDPPTSEVFLSTDFTGPLTSPDLNSVPASIHATVDKIEQQSSFNDKDVAIVHVNNMNDMPSIQLGDSSNVQQQDNLRIIGFPGNGDVNNSPTDLLTSSVIPILVSSIKTTSSGAPVIQVSGNVEHGDSGGPALDSQGNVVGIVSFGSNTPGNTSFLQAGNSARDLVQTLHLNTSPGKFQQLWNQAFTDYALTTPGHWHKAQQEFQQLSTSYSLFKAVTPFLSYSQAQAKNERLPQQPTPTSQANNRLSGLPGGSLITLILVGIGVLIIIVLIILARMVFRRPKPASNPNNVPQPSRQPPSPAPHNQAQNSFVNPRPNNNSMSAFGAPPAAPQSNQVPPVSPGALPSRVNGSMPIAVSETLRPWPCGHMNRSNARFCSICGEPAPSASVRTFEQ